VVENRDAVAHHQRLFLVVGDIQNGGLNVAVDAHNLNLPSSGAVFSSSDA